MKRRISLTILVGLVIAAAIAVPINIIRANESNVSEDLAVMTTKEKVAEMLMPSFRWSCETKKDCNVTEITPEIETLLGEYNFAGVILFSQNFTGTEQTVRLIDAIQKANQESNFNSQLLIATDQEGGYVTRLSNTTNMPGNMALGATNDKNLAFSAAEVIGKELEALGINVDFAPVSDVNNNPANPVIGVRSFSDDPDMVGDFASAFMRGLKSANIMTALKHFPGHGDASMDTHTDIVAINKTYDDLKNVELKPFQKLMNEGTDMVMTAHIQYPQIETKAYVSKKDGSTMVKLPATLSEEILTKVLREDMGYTGVVVTDGLDMGAISQHFDRLDIAKLAINAGADILLMPVETNGAAAIDDFKKYIDDVTNLVETEQIDIKKVDAAVERILRLKKKHGLLEKYDVGVDTKVAKALEIVSTKESNAKDFEIAKEAVTLIKNENQALPIKADGKTTILYNYDSHKNAAEYAIQKLMQDGIINSGENVEFYNFVTDFKTIKEKMGEFDNVVIINAMYDLNDRKVDSEEMRKIDEVISLANENKKKLTYISTQLPYDVARFEKADAIIAVYLANGLKINPNDFESDIPSYAKNVIAGIYQIFNGKAKISGKLPVNIYKLNLDFSFSDKILYARGHGLTYQ